MTTEKRAKRSARKPKIRGSSLKKKYVAPKTVKEFHLMPTQHLQIYLKVLTLIGLMREGSSLTAAMRKLGLKRAQVDGFGSSALRKQKNGRYVAKAYDHLLRVMRVVSNGGLREVGTRDSRQASKAAKHSAAVHRYLETGDDSAWASRAENKQ
jgi:hypothetical protein